MTRPFTVDPQERVLILRQLGHAPNSDRIISTAKAFNRKPSEIARIAQGAAA